MSDDDMPCPPDSACPECGDRGAEWMLRWVCPECGYRRQLKTATARDFSEVDMHELARKTGLWRRGE